MTINQNLLEAVMRMKDAMIMFPQPASDRLKRRASTSNTVVPEGYPIDLDEWFDYIRSGRKFESTNEPRLKPEPTTGKRRTLTEKDKMALRSMSYKTGSSINFMMVA